MQNTVKELIAAKRFNKLAAGLIIIMLIIMCFMVRELEHWAERYEQLADGYEQLYEEIKGGEQQ